MVDKSEPSSEITTVELKKDWKLYCGVVLLAASLLFPLAALAVPFLGLSPGMAAMLAGFCVIGAPELCALVAVALLGKETWNFLVAKLKSHAGVLFPTRVSKTRYYTGLAINILSIIPLYMAGYLPDLLPAEPGRLYILIAGDFAFVASFFILGGQFWEKFKQLFVYE